MSKLQSKDFLNISCIVETSAQGNRKIITFVPIKDVYKAGVGSGLLGAGIGGAGVYAALHKKLTDNSETIQSLRNKLADAADSSETDHSLHNKLASVLDRGSKYAHSLYDKLTDDETVHSLHDKLASILNDDDES
jgi:hypothetical protein